MKIAHLENPLQEEAYFDAWKEFESLCNIRDILNEDITHQQKVLQTQRDEIVALSQLQDNLSERLYPGCPSEPTYMKLFCPLTGCVMMTPILLPNGIHVDASSLGLILANGKLQIDTTTPPAEKVNPEVLYDVFSSLFKLTDRETIHRLFCHRPDFDKLLMSRLSFLVVDYSVKELAEAYVVKTYAPNGSFIEGIKLRPIEEEWVRDLVTLETLEKPMTLDCGHSLSAEVIDKCENKCPECRAPITIARPNGILAAFAQEFINREKKAILVKDIAYIEQEILQIKTLQEVYEKQVHDLNDRFIRLQASADQPDDVIVQELEEKEERIREQQRRLVLLEHKLPLLNELHEGGKRLLQGMQGENSGSDSKEADEKELQRTQFLKGLATRTFFRLEESFRRDLEKQEEIQLKLLQLQKTLDLFKKDERTVLELQAVLGDTIAKRAALPEEEILEKIREAKQHKEEALDNHTKSLTGLQDVKEELMRRRNYLSHLQEHPLHVLSRDVVHIGLDHARPFSEDRVQKELKAYIRNPIESELKATRNKLRSLSQQILQLQANPDTVELTYTLAIRIIGQLRSYSTCFYNADSVISKQRCEQISDIMQAKRVQEAALKQLQDAIQFSGLNLDLDQLKSSKTI